MSTKERKIKASLVRARQVIADKFRKLSRKRLMYERELEAKYAPITDSINKLIETKSLLHNEKKKAVRDYSDNENDQMEVDNDEDLISFNDDKVKKEPTESIVELNDKKSENHNLDRKLTNDEYDVIKIYTPENKVMFKNPSSSSEEISASTRKSLSSKRKSDRINEYDAHRFREDEQTDQAQLIFCLRHYHYCHQTRKK